jgi:hypothetical protein
MVFRPVIVSIVATALAAPPTLDDYKKGKSDAAADKKAAAASEAKMAAVNKVINMMSDLQTQVLAEGEKEAASYEKFACFCKDTTSEKSAAIKKGTDEQASISANLGKLYSKRDDLDKNIKTLTKEIEELEKAMKKSTKERKETMGVYTANEADLSSALEALDGAIDVLKSSKNPSLAQLNSIAKTVRTASLMADALGLENSSKLQQAVGFFLQQDPSVPMENYKFHSDSVIDMLEKLKGDFRKEKQELDAAEVKSVAEYDAFMQEHTDLVKAKNLDLDDNKKERENTISSIAMNSEEMTTVSADLLDDKEYLADLAQMCMDKAKTWDQRSKVRSDELSAITAALTIVKETVAEKTSAATVRFAQQGVSVRMAERLANSDLAMEAIEEESEEADVPGKAPVAFLQRLVQRHSPDDGRQAVINMLKTSGLKMHSTLLTSLASEISADPFAKIKVLIQELIQRLLTEAANEGNQKGWCDKAMADATQKRDYSADKIEELNGEMASLEALRNKLTEEITVLNEESADLDAKRKEATEMRKEEKAENEETVVQAGAGLEAVNMAIDILDKFYKTAAKEDVDLGLLQGPADDAPDAGFDNGEAYTGAGGEAGGIIGMLDVIKSDFERTISATKKAEDQAATEYRNFMTASGKSLAEKTMASAEKTKQKDTAVEELEDADDALAAQTAILQGAIGELLNLKPTCIDTGMSYDERVARREDEIDSLTKALCVLKNYAEFGPEGAGNNC